MDAKKSKITIGEDLKAAISEGVAKGLSDGFKTMAEIMNRKNPEQEAAKYVLRVKYAQD